MSGTEHPARWPTESDAAPASSGAAPEATVDAAAGTAEVPAPLEPATIEEVSSGVAAPAQPPPVPQARSKTKGVADIVFVVDISGSMSPCIDALRRNIETFIDSLEPGRRRTTPRR